MLWMECKRKKTLIKIVVETFSIEGDQCISLGWVHHITDYLSPYSKKNTQKQKYVTTFEFFFVIAMATRR